MTGGFGMRHRGFISLGILAIVSIAVPAAAQTQAGGAKSKTATTAKDSTPRTPWGAPDLQGVWDRHTITPLQRPNGKDQEVLSDEEVTSLEAETAERNNVDKNRKVGTDADVGRAY